MKALVIVDINITDPVGYDEYRSVVGPTIEKFNGKIIVVVTKGDGKSEVLEGNWDPTHLVILEFESMDQARKWYNSSEYTEVAEIRKKTSTANFILVGSL